ncbi:MAG: hypothetical protein IKR49_08545 [Clostridia bacterium]|nr:hypothetical protein [Clostridia bacterium]
MIEKLLRTLHSKECEIYYIKDGQRFALAECNARLEISSQQERLPLLGNRSMVLKHYLTIAVCDDMNLKEEVDASFLKTISKIEIAMFLQRRDGKQERFMFSNMTPIEIVLDGEWTFEIIEDYALIRRLLAEF